jgi:hypothetical protein
MQYLPSESINHQLNRQYCRPFGLGAVAEERRVEADWFTHICKCVLGRLVLKRLVSQERPRLTSTLAHTFSYLDTFQKSCKKIDKHKHAVSPCKLFNPKALFLFEREYVQPSVVRRFLSSQVIDFPLGFMRYLSYISFVTRNPRPKEGTYIFAIAHQPQRPPSQ